jgi:hypothetical protein
VTTEIILLLSLSDAVRRNPLISRATDADIGNSMKLWLRGAGDRGGGQESNPEEVCIIARSRVPASV